MESKKYPAIKVVLTGSEEVVPAGYATAGQVEINGTLIDIANMLVNLGNALSEIEMPKTIALGAINAGYHKVENGTLEIDMETFKKDMAKELFGL